MPDLIQEEKITPDFLENLRLRIVDDYAKAKEFMGTYHEWCKQKHADYHASEKYTDLRVKNKIPVTWTQEDVDTFAADSQDKLWFSGRPCRIVGREEEDKLDAEAKQAFQDYQDEEDDMFSKTMLALRDGALYKAAAMQVNYEERTKREWVQESIKVPAMDELGMPMMDEMGQPAMIDSGQTQWVLQDLVIYKGAACQRIDMQNIFFGIDKSSMSDHWPVMVQSFQDKEFFNTQPYFFEAGRTELAEKAAAKGNQNEASEKKSSGTLSEKPYEYIEWHGYVDKMAFYQYAIAAGLKDYKGQPYSEQHLAEVRPGDRCYVLAGLVDSTIWMRLQYDPFRWGKPNLIIGYIDPEEDSVTGRSISQMIECYQRGGENIEDILFQNFKQSVNAQWYFNDTALTGKKTIVNKAGGIITGNTEPGKAFSRIPVENVSKDIYLNLERLRENARNADGVKVIVTGGGDPNAETLGENQMALSQASLRMRNYLRTYEKSFIIPLYQLRNHINATLIDVEYAFKVVGQKAENWRVIQPEQLRTTVDFICESSTRETNRAVITQQILQFIEIAPLAVQTGVPVRIDKMMSELAINGFGWSMEKVYEIFPLLRLEEEQGIDVDSMLLQNSLMNMVLPPAPTNGSGGPGQQARPLNEGEAAENANQKNQTPIRSMMR
jgi:hypothetical protein